MRRCEVRAHPRSGRGGEPFAQALRLTGRFRLTGEGPHRCVEGGLLVAKGLSLEGGHRLGQLADLLQQLRDGVVTLLQRRPQVRDLYVRCCQLLFHRLRHDRERRLASFL